MPADKAAHFLLGLIASLVIWPFEPLASFVVVLIGAAGKEFYDYQSGKGTPEAADFLATVAGGTVLPFAALVGGLWLVSAIWWMVAVSLVFAWLYTLTMNVYAAHREGKLGPVAFSINLLPIALAVILDILYQFTLATLVFWDRPRHMLVTKRLQAYLRGPDGWRKRRAHWWCTHLMNPLDRTGNHCE